MIILYGSFARGDWVRDLPHGYHSDTDILIILKKGKYKGYTALRLKYNYIYKIRKNSNNKP
ncbi:MAG: nucleotidyltransferase domain-containing protein [Rickettsia aeschlimannii]